MVAMDSGKQAREKQGKWKIKFPAGKNQEIEKLIKIGEYM